MDSLPLPQAEQVSKACEEQEMIQAMKELAKRGATYATGCAFVDERDPFLEDEQIRMTMKRPRDGEMVMLLVVAVVEDSANMKEEVLNLRSSERECHFLRRVGSLSKWI